MASPPHSPESPGLQPTPPDPTPSVAPPLTTAYHGFTAALRNHPGYSPPKPKCGSAPVLEYIDETWKSGTPIFPQDPYERAIARFWAKFIDDKCVPAVWKACFGKGEEQEKAIEEAKEHLKTLENEVKGKKFFGGESIGVVDIVANFIGLWTGVFQEVMGVELLTKDKYPRLIEWSDEYLRCSIIKEKLPPRDELVRGFQALFG